MKPDELRSRWRGVQVVLVTPMRSNLEVDLDGLPDWLRITIGRNDEMQRLLDALDEVAMHLDRSPADPALPG